MITIAATNTRERCAAQILRLAGRAALGLVGVFIWLSISVVHALARTWAIRVSFAQPVNPGAFEDWLLPGPTDAAADWLRAVIPAHDGLQLAAMLWLSLFWASVVISALVMSTVGWRHFVRLVAMYAAVVLVADAMFAVLPTMPPWMSEGVPRLLASKQQFLAADPNPTAAMPSLHVALPTLCAIWFCRHEQRAFRWFGALLAIRALFMAWAVVYTGEHWVSDCVAGAMLSTGVYLAFDHFGWAQARAKPRTGADEPTLSVTGAETHQPLAA